MTETGRPGAIREVLATRGRRLYDVVCDRTARAGVAPLVGGTVGEFAAATTGDAFDVLP
jgi:hypothetical protein